MMGRQTSDQSQLFYLFNLERRIPASHLPRRINPVVTRILTDLREILALFYSEGTDPSGTGATYVSRLHKPVVLVTMFAGQVITGGVVSFTLTVKVQLAVLPLASVAVQVTVVAPTGKTLPLAGTQVTFVTEQLSVAVAA